MKMRQHLSDYKLLMNGDIFLDEKSHLSVHIYQVELHGENPDFKFTSIFTRIRPEKMRSGAKIKTR